MDGQKRLVRWSGGNSDIVMQLPEALRLDRRKMSLTAPPGAALTLRLAYLTQKVDIQYCDMIESFMLFTNDLDASRGQNILELNRELVDAFAAFGKPWDRRRQYWKG